MFSNLFNGGSTPAPDESKEPPASVSADEPQAGIGSVARNAPEQSISDELPPSPDGKSGLAQFQEASRPLLSTEEGEAVYDRKTDTKLIVDASRLHTSVAVRLKRT